MSRAADFSNIPTEQRSGIPTAEITVEVGDLMSAVITMRPANEDNPKYFNELLRRNRRLNRSARSRDITTDDIRKMRRDDCELLARYCAVGWKGVVDAEGELPFSPENCREFLLAVLRAPRGRIAFDEFRDRAADEYTFMEDDYGGGGGDPEAEREALEGN